MSLGPSVMRKSTFLGKGAAFGFLGLGFYPFYGRLLADYWNFFLFRLNFSIFDAPVFVSTLAEMVNPCSFRLNINLKNICGEEIFLA